MNPPYNLKGKTAFVERAIKEAEAGKTCVLLIPSATETALFERLFKSAQEILFIRGRVPFKGTNTKGVYVTDKCGQSGSMLVTLSGLQVFSPRVGILYLKDTDNSSYANNKEDN